MKTIERAKEFYGNAPDGHPEWDDLTESEQDAYLAWCIKEGKITECNFIVNPDHFIQGEDPVFCDEEAYPVTGYCEYHWDDITRNWRDR